jgi:hypothetical protein
MPHFEIISFPVEADSFVLTPAIVITQGRDAETLNLAPSFAIQVQWLMWGFGICVTF